MTSRGGPPPPRRNIGTKTRLPSAVAERPVGAREPRAHADGDEAGQAGEVPADDAERVDGRSQPVDRRPQWRARRPPRWCRARRRGAPRWPPCTPALTPEARKRRSTPSSRLGGDVHRERDEAEGREHHADVAGEVVVVRCDAAELGVGRLAEHPGQHEHGDQREADEADGDHRLAGQQAQLRAGEAQGGRESTGAPAGCGGDGGGDGGHAVPPGVRATKRSSRDGLVDPEVEGRPAEADEVGADVGEHGSVALHDDLGAVAVDPVDAGQVAERAARRGRRR